MTITLALVQSEVIRTGRLGVEDGGKDLGGSWRCSEYPPEISLVAVSVERAAGRP